MNSSNQYLNLNKDLWHECLESSYGFLRASWPRNWLGMPVVLLECLRFLNLQENNVSDAGRSMLKAAKSVASEIEKQSVNFLKPILDSHSVPDEWQKIIDTVIVRSDFSIVHQNHAQVAGKAFEWNLEWLCVLLNEADVMASASSKYGPVLGDSLAQEWRLIDFPLHSSVASLEGRKNFLKQLIFSSPSSLVLGLGEKISEEILTINS